ncbi:hypothetical protein BVX97_01420 [bacterium E08(2017)]|nr:hypothetical protein BVX97_01420 [bacterium E08(2017)]
MSVLLAVVTFSIARSCSNDAAPGSSETVVFLSSIYIPVFSALFYHMKEGGFFTTEGYTRLAIISSGIIVILLVPNIPAVNSAISESDHVLMTPLLKQIPIPLTGVILFLICAPFFFSRNGFESPLLGSYFLTAMFFAFAALSINSPFWPEDACRVVLFSFISGSALTYISAVMESSWRNANIDELTELPGRRALKHHLARLSNNYTIAMIDIDHFKKVNDKYGHDTGDQVLRFIANFLRHNGAGKAYRYGGEEFTIIADNMTLKETAAVLDDMREAIASREFIIRSTRRPRKTPDGVSSMRGRNPANGKTINITVSIGISHPGKNDLQPQEVIMAADKALYRAKKAGRNQVRTTR